MTNAKGPLKRPPSISGSVIAGLLLVPLTAVAAIAIATTTSRPPSVMASDETTTTTLAASTTTEAQADPADTLSAACSGGAAKLLDKEREGTLSDVQTAALDALREVCAANDMGISGPPVPEAVVRVVQSAGSTTSTTTTMQDADNQGSVHQGSDDDYESDHEDHEDEDHEDHEDEDHEEDHGGEHEDDH